MALQIGDYVRFLNEVGEGKVVEIMSNTMVRVCDTTGFDVPMLMSQVVKVDGPSASGKAAGKMSTPPSKTAPAQPAAKKIPPAQMVPPGALLSEKGGNEHPLLLFSIPIPEGDLEKAQYQCFLINDSNYHALYLCSMRKGSTLELVEAGTIEANTKMRLTGFTIKELQQFDALVFQCIWFKTASHEQQAPVSTEIVLSPIKLFKQGSYRENDFFDQKALMHTLYEAPAPAAASGSGLAERLQAAMTSPKTAPAAPIKATPIDQIKEIDLHIETLVPGGENLSPGDKLEAQLKSFEKELNIAISGGWRQAVFIHGVGNGVLKLRIRQILDKQYRSLNYQDASFEKYKFGATMVTLR